MGCQNYLYLNSLVTFDPTVYLVCLLAYLDSTATCIIDHNIFSAGQTHILNMDCLVKFNNYLNMLISTYCTISSTKSFYFETLLKLTHSVDRTMQRFAQFPNIHIIAIPSKYIVRRNICNTCNHSHGTSQNLNRGRSGRLRTGRSQPNIRRVRQFLVGNSYNQKVS